MSVADVAPVPELRAEEITEEVMQRLASYGESWRAKITPAAILDGVASGALRCERIHRCVEHDRVNRAWICKTWEDVVDVRPRFDGELRFAAWNAWCVKYGMGERRIVPKAQPAPAKAQNRPGLPAGPEKGNETAQLSNGISEPKPRRAARARSAARA